MRVLRTLVLLLVAFVLLALGIDAIVGLRQPVLQPGAAEGVLRVFADMKPVRLDPR